MVIQAKRATPVLPQGGGDYKKYLSEIEDVIGWNPSLSDDPLAEHIQKSIEEINDPRMWVAFAGKALQRAWKALPEEIRRDAIREVGNLVEEAIDNITDAGEELAASIGEKIGNALPIIGAIIETAVILITTVYKSIKSTEASNRWISGVNKIVAQGNTIREYDNPDMWVFGSMRVRLYARYAGFRGVGKGDWDARPSLRSSGEADLMFTQIAGQSDEGWCGTGVPYKCGQWDDMEDLRECTPKPSKNHGHECVRRISTSALFFPYWSPAYGSNVIEDIPGYAYKNEHKQSHAIKILAARQMALLTSPTINLKVNGARLRGIADTFKSYWDSMTDRFAPPGAEAGLLEIDGDLAPGTAVADRLTIDSQKVASYVPSQQNKNRFYYDDDGLIHKYPGASGSTGEWGVRAKGDIPQMAISIDQYNAVIGNTLAFFSARANFLRDGLTMQALLMDFGKSHFAGEVRSAMQYAANYGAMLPTAQVTLAEGPTPERMPKPPGRYSPDQFFVVGAKTKGKKSSALPLLLVGGGLIAVMAMKGKKR